MRIRQAERCKEVEGGFTIDDLYDLRDMYSGSLVRLY